MYFFVTIQAVLPFKAFVTHCSMYLFVTMQAVIPCKPFVTHYTGTFQQYVFLCDDSSCPSF